MATWAWAAPAADPATAVALPDMPRSTAEVPWSDFARILEELRKTVEGPEKVPPPPVGYALGRTLLAATVSDDQKSLVVDVRVEVTVLEPEKWVEVPLFGADVAVSEAAIDGRPAPLFARGGQLFLALHGRGPRMLTGRFSARVAESSGTHSCYFSSWLAPASGLELSLPGTGLEVTPSPGVLAAKREEGGRTMATIALPATSGVQLAWRPAPRERAAADPGAGKVHAEVKTLVTAGEGVVSATTVVDYRIYQTRLRKLAVVIPAAMRLLDVSGVGITRWHDVEAAGDRRVDVELGFDAEDGYRLTLVYEQELTSASATVALPAVVVDAVDRQTGFIAVSAAGSVEVVQTGSAQDLATLDPSELPDDVAAMGGGDAPVLFAYRYIRVPYRAEIGIERHADLEVKRSIIERAEITSFVTREGKELWHALYRIKNNQKQYLEVTLPEGAEAWGTYLDGAPVKASAEGKRLLLPLRKARATDAGAAAFPVELVFFRQVPAMGIAGTLAFTPPSTDLECLELSWQLYLPPDAGYLGFSGDLGAHLERSGEVPLPPPMPAQLPRTDAPDEPEPMRQALSNVIVSQGYAGHAVAAGKGGEARGVLPVKIPVPRHGQGFVVSKRVVKAGEAPDLKLRYRPTALPGRGHLMVLLLALVWSAALVSILRRGVDVVRRREALFLLVFGVVVVLVQRGVSGSAGAAVAGLALPVVLFLARLLTRRAPVVALLFVLLGAGGGAPVARAQEPAPPDLPETNLRIPWTDMKALMERILAAQRGVEPPIQPPMPYAITSNELAGRVAEDGLTASFTLDVTVEVLEPKEWVAIPVMAGGVALAQATLDDQPAPLTTQLGGLHLVLRGAGTHRFRGAFSVPVARDRATRTLSLPLPQASVTTLGLAIPEAGIEVTPAQGVLVSSREEAGITHATIALPGSGWATVSWQTKKDEAAATVEGKVQADVRTLVSVGEGVESGVSVVDYRLFSKKLTRLAVALPAAATVLDVQGSGIRATREQVEGERRVVMVDLDFEVEGQYALTVSYEVPLDAKTGKGHLPLVEVRDVDRQSGHVAVTARTNVEVAAVGEPRGLSPLDPSELPPALVQLAGGDVLLGYRYIKLPYGLDLAVTRHEDLALKRSIIEHAEVVSFMGEDGKVLTQVSYRVKNNQKQHLRVTLPEGAEVWGTYLAGEPVKGARDGQGRLLVPLHQSRLGEDNMKPFLVELVYFRQSRPLWGLGRRSLALPAADLECLRVHVTAYVPEDFQVYGLGGTLIEEPPQVYTVTSSTASRLGGRPAPKSAPVDLERARDAKDKLRSLGYVGDSDEAGAAAPAEAMNEPMPMKEARQEALAPAAPPPPPAIGKSNARDDLGLALGGGAYNQAQMKAGTAKGVLPVRIEVPCEGRPLYFGGEIVRPGEAPDASFWFLARKLHDPLTYLLFAISALLSALALSAIKSASFRTPGVARASVMVACVVAIVLGVVLATGRIETVLHGVLLPLSLYVVYLVLRREPERGF